MPESNAVAPMATMLTSFVSTMSPKRENPRTQGAEPKLTDNITMSITRAEQNPVSTLNGSPVPLASTRTIEAAGQP